MLERPSDRLSDRIIDTINANCADQRTMKQRRRDLNELVERSTVSHRTPNSIPI